MAIGVRRLITFGLMAVVVNSFFRILPLFVQTRATSVEVMHLTLAFVSVALLIIALLLLKKKSAA